MSDADLLTESDLDLVPDDTDDEASGTRDNLGISSSSAGVGTEGSHDNVAHSTMENVESSTASSQPVTTTATTTTTSTATAAMSTSGRSYYATALEHAASGDPELLNASNRIALVSLFGTLVAVE